MQLVRQVVKGSAQELSLEILGLIQRIRALTYNITSKCWKLQTSGQPGFYLRILEHFPQDWPSHVLEGVWASVTNHFFNKLPLIKKSSHEDDLQRDEVRRCHLALRKGQKSEDSSRSWYTFVTKATYDCSRPIFSSLVKWSSQTARQHGWGSV